MTMPAWTRALPWIGLLATGSWYVHQIAEAHSLENALQSARATGFTATTVSPAAPAPQPASGNQYASAADSAFDPEAFAEQVRSRVTTLTNPGLGLGHPDVIFHFESSLASLGPAEWAAIIAGDPAFRFATQHDQRTVTGDQRLDAILRWRALRKLATADPPAALRLMECTDLKDTSGDMINLITSSLQRWTEADPAAAVRWGKDHADQLPLGINHAHMGLEALARTDMTAAWARARSEGLDPTQAMAYLSRATGTRDDCEAFMTEIAALQAASPHGFVGGANQYYGEFAAKLATSEGFEEARSFLEKWASPLEWRDAPALEAVQTTFARTIEPRSLEAATWFMEFAPESRRAEAAARLVTAWAQEDFSQPAEWLKSQRGAAWHDDGLAALVRAIAPFDAEAAAAWACEIKNPSLRDKALAPSKTGE